MNAVLVPISEYVDKLENAELVLLREYHKLYRTSKDSLPVISPEQMLFSFRNLCNRIEKRLYFRTLLKEDEKGILDGYNNLNDDEHNKHDDTAGRIFVIKNCELLKELMICDYILQKFYHAVD